MVTSVTQDVQIANSALIKMGAEPILSLLDDSNRARIMRAQYPIKRDELFRAHPWKFSTAYTSLARITPTPPEIFDYSYAFQLPTDCARVFKTNLEDGAWTEMEGGLLLTECSEVKIRYGRIIKDVTKYDASFVELLALLLAADTVYAITQSAAARDGLEKKYTTALREARSYSAQVGSTQQVQAEDWLNARSR